MWPKFTIKDGKYQPNREFQPYTLLPWMVIHAKGQRWDFIYINDNAGRTVMN